MKDKTAALDLFHDLESPRQDRMTDPVEADLDLFSDLEEPEPDLLNAAEEAVFSNEVEISEEAPEDETDLSDEAESLEDAPEDESDEADLSDEEEFLQEGPKDDADDYDLYDEEELSQEDPEDEPVEADFVLVDEMEEVPDGSEFSDNEEAPEQVLEVEPVYLNNPHMPLFPRSFSMMKPLWFFFWPVVPVGFPVMVFSPIIIYTNNNAPE
ncbi:MAG: hypothetical protein IJI57_13070 [Flexilinea sp.]|nr:hypothetical protein [Flexilinea sp.]